MMAEWREGQREGACRLVKLILTCCCTALLATSHPSAALAGAKPGGSPNPRPPCLAGLDQKVSFDLRDTEATTIFELLARESNVNIVISPYVQGKITIRLENVSRWEALRNIVETMHLRMEEAGCVLRIYAAEDILRDNEMINARLRQQELEGKNREKEAEIRDKEARARLSIAEAQRVERTAAPLITKSVPVRFVGGKKLAEDLQKLMPEMAELKGGEPPRPEKRFVTYNADSNSIIIRDTQKNVDEMLLLIRELDQETRQVLIEARIVETTRSFVRDMGIQWGFLARGLTDRNFPATWGIQGGHVDNDSAAPFLSPPLSGAGNWVVNFPFTPSDTGSALGMTFANIANTFALDIQISAAEQNDDIHILSNPRIITSDNQAAVIKSGSEIPFQVQEELGQFKIEFKEAVIQLEVTPHVVADDLINMDVMVKKDEPDFIRTVQGNPSIFKKEARTRILMKDGGTLIIGGLTRDRHAKLDRGVPWLSRVPLLKHLFSQTRNTKDYEELMVFITPRMIPRLVSEEEN